MGRADLARFGKPSYWRADKSFGRTVAANNAIRFWAFDVAAINAVLRSNRKFGRGVSFCHLGRPLGCRLKTLFQR